MSDTEDQLLAALSSALTVISNTHANGYSHSNPWDECDSPICVELRQRIHAARIKIKITWQTVNVNEGEQ